MKIKLLDCTLRDGGYYTNWDFDPQMVKDLIQSLDLACVDVIELGYKSPVKGGKFRKCNDRFIWEILDHKLPVNSKLAFMIDAKDFITQKGTVNYSLIDDVIHDSTDSPFSICRLAIKIDELEPALLIGKYIKSKGYDVIINLMGISLLNDSQIGSFKKIKSLKPLALYFAGASTTVQNLATTEEYDGSSWTEVADLSTGRKSGGSGTSNASGNITNFFAGGIVGTTQQNITEEWTVPFATKTIGTD